MRLPDDHERMRVNAVDDPFQAHGFGTGDDTVENSAFRTGLGALAREQRHAAFEDLEDLL